MRASQMSRLLLMAILLLPTPLLAQLRFQEGRHYSVVPVTQPSGTVPAGKIEVAEVFSYLCGGCFQAQGLADEIKAGLPADAAMAYVHAGFNRDWPLFQRAHLTAQQLGIADASHARMFAGIWQTGEVPYFDPSTGKPRQTPPVIRDLARFYARGGGVAEDAFVKQAASAQVDAAVARTEALIKGWQVGSTPTFVVAGRYRIEHSGVSSAADMRALVTYLVGLERTRLQSTGGGKPAPASKPATAPASKPAPASTNKPASK